MKVIKLNSYVLPVYILMLIPPILVIPLILKYILLFVGLFAGVKILKSKISTKRMINITNKNFLVCVFIDIIMYMVIYTLSVFLPHFKLVKPLEEQIMLNPFSSFTIGVCFIVALLIEGILSYFWIKRQLIKSGFSKLIYNKVAIITSIIAAPYIILIPKSIIEGVIFMQ